MKNTRLVLACLVLLVLVAAGCAHKKTAAAPPPPPPPPATPTATIAANPTSVQAGQSVTLSWNTKNADKVTIDGLGTVAASGSQTVKPSQSTDYTLTAQGPGGNANASARVTVMAQAMAPTTDDLLKQFNAMISDVYFDYDKYDIRADQQPLIQKAANFLGAHPDLKVTIEGHCDDRGSEEYNLALGDNRANALKTALIADGASSAQFKTVSYGKEKPFCTEETEQCWAQNRRDHYVRNGN